MSLHDSWKIRDLHFCIEKYVFMSAIGCTVGESDIATLLCSQAILKNEIYGIFLYISHTSILAASQWNSIVSSRRFSVELCDGDFG